MASILYKWLLSVALIVVCSAGKLHPIYVSVTEIEHNAKEQSLEISCKIFTDDFEKALRKYSGKYIDLIHPADKAEMNRLVSSYVKAHLKVNADGKDMELKFIGYEQIEEGIYSYYQAEDVKTVSTLKVTDNILFEYKNEQMNLVHVTINGNRKSTKLNNPDAEAVFRF